MTRSLLLTLAAAALTAGCAGTKIQHASVDQRASHNELYSVSAEPVVIDKETGWVNVKVKIESPLGTDSVAFNMIVR